jgi:hypothetical protein
MTKENNDSIGENSTNLVTLRDTIDPAFPRRTGLPDFSWCMIPKPEKCTKRTQNVPNGHKISQISTSFSKRP